MGDTRRHRGPHPADEQLFATEAVPTLRAAVADLSFLRTRGYAEPSASKIVGDRYQLRQRQRVAVGRCACADQKRVDRLGRRIAIGAARRKPLAIDGLNVITTIEVALAGGVLLLGRDGCMRDMASFHGSYRVVEETPRAVSILVAMVQAIRPSRAVVYIDRPVSNSGRLAEAVRGAAAAAGIALEASTADRVDAILASEDAVVATADSAILDGCSEWMSLARVAVEQHQGEMPPLWLLDLS